MPDQVADAVVVERRVAASPTHVYGYLTVGDRWARWQGRSADIDARPGGIFAMEMATGQRARGQFVELEPDRRVVFTWGWIDHPGVPPGSSTVAIDLIPDGDGTIIRLTHTGLPTEELPLHRMGWDHCLDRLVILVDGGDPGPDPGPDPTPTPTP